MSSKKSSEQDDLSKALRTIFSIATLALYSKGLQKVYDQTYERGIRKLR